MYTSIACESARVGPWTAYFKMMKFVWFIMLSTTCSWWERKLVWAMNVLYVWEQGKVQIQWPDAGAGSGVDLCSLELWVLGGGSSCLSGVDVIGRPKASGSSLWGFWSRKQRTLLEARCSWRCYMWPLRMYSWVTEGCMTNRKRVMEDSPHSSLSG